MNANKKESAHFHLFMPKEFIPVWIKFKRLIEMDEQLISVVKNNPKVFKSDKYLIAPGIRALVSRYVRDNNHKLNKQTEEINEANKTSN